jgi:hypothetical protein
MFVQEDTATISNLINSILTLEKKIIFLPTVGLPVAGIATCVHDCTDVVSHLLCRNSPKPKRRRGDPPSQWRIGNGSFYVPMIFSSLIEVF